MRYGRFYLASRLLSAIPHDSVTRAPPGVTDTKLGCLRRDSAVDGGDAYHQHCSGLALATPGN